MTNGTASGTNGIARGTNGDSLLSCPFCGGDAELIEDEPTKGFYVVECANCAAHGPMSNRDTAIRLWNRRAAVTDRDFATAVHDGRTWVCVEGALESDVLKPIEGFTRDSIYRDSMLEYGEWMEKAESLMRDMFDVAARGEFDVGEEAGFAERLREFGIEVGR